MSEFLNSIAVGAKTVVIALVMTFVSLFSPAPLKGPPAIPTAPLATSSKIHAATATSTKPKISTASSTVATTTPTAVIKKTKKTTLPPATPSATPATSSPSIVTPEWDSINERARSAVVNILCTSKSAGLTQPISGSGVFIDPHGIILTNAHIAQYWLIKDYPSKDFLDCVIRQGSPAAPRYRAELVYISSTWVKTHYKDILEQNPIGTGENDFALLVVNGTTGPSIQLPSAFPYLPPAATDTDNILGQAVIMAAYPAGFLGGVSIQTALFTSSAPATIQDVYTFTDTTVDILSLGGTIIAQHGSSGGAIVTGDGKLRGIIVTTSDANNTAARDLHAITLSYINRRLAGETGFSLSDLLGSNVHAVAEEFNQIVGPALTKLLVQTLTQAGL